MIILSKTKLVKLPKSCVECPMCHNMGKTLRENERLTGTSMICNTTKKLLYVDDYYGQRPKSCPLIDILEAFEGFMKELISESDKGNENKQRSKSK